MNLSLGNDANQNKLGACGCSEVVVKTLKLHMNEEEAAKMACCAIWCLAMNNFANQNKVGACGCCEVVVKALNKHLDENEVVLNKDAKQY